MPQNRVVVTGLGVLSSNGIGKDAFQESLFKGVSGIKPVALFDVAGLKVKTAGEIRDFQPQNILGPKGLRNLDRSTKLINCAVKLALDDAHLNITEENTRQVGVAVGTTLGSVQSMCDLDREVIKDGPKYISPGIFPNTVINSPASQVSIRFNIKGFNTTISTGFASSLDAINYAAGFIRLGRAKAVAAGGVEELCIPTYLGFYKTGMLAGILEGSQELSCPFDQRRNGAIFGEGAGTLILEDLESAVQRGARIYAEIKGFGTSFDAFRINQYNPKGTGLKRAMKLALKNSNLGVEQIDYISAAANSTPEADLIETRCIKDVFEEYAYKVNISAIKSMTGECFSASGVLQAIASVCAMNKEIVPPTINYFQKDAFCDLDYVVNQARSVKITHALINAFGPSGCNSSLILSGFVG